VLPFEPEVAQTAGVCEAKTTGLPDVPPVADAINDALFVGISEMGGNVIA
jgi:hypothetical protein